MNIILWQHKILKTSKTSACTSRIRFIKVWTDSGRMTMSMIIEEIGVMLLGQRKLISIKAQLKKIEHGRGVMKCQYSRDMMLIIRKYGKIKFWKEEKGERGSFPFHLYFSACISQVDNIIILTIDYKYEKSYKENHSLPLA